MTALTDDRLDITAAEQRELIAAYLDVDAQIRKLEESKTALRERIASFAGGHKDIAVDGHTVLTQSPNRRFNARRCEQLLAAHPDLLALCTKTAIDSATAKKNLPPALYEAAMVEAGLPRLNIVDRA